jgi:hypothetical protein
VPSAAGRSGTASLPLTLGASRASPRRVQTHMRPLAHPERIVSVNARCEKLALNNIRVSVPTSPTRCTAHNNSIEEKYIGTAADIEFARRLLQRIEEGRRRVAESMGLSE